MISYQRIRLIFRSQEDETFRDFIPLLDQLKTKCTEFRGNAQEYNKTIGACGSTFQNMGEAVQSAGLEMMK